MEGGIIKSKSRYARVTKKCRAFKKDLIVLTSEQLRKYEEEQPHKIVTVTYYKKLKSSSFPADLNYEKRLRPIDYDPASMTPFYRDPLLRYNFISSFEDTSNIRNDPRLRCVNDVVDPRLRKRFENIFPVASTSRENEVDILYEGENPQKILDIITIDSDDNRLEDFDDDDNNSSTDSNDRNLLWDLECYSDDNSISRGVIDFITLIDSDIGDDDDCSLESVGYWNETVV